MIYIKGKIEIILSGVFMNETALSQGNICDSLKEKVSTHTQAWKKLPEKYLRTMVVPLVVHRQTLTNNKSNVHSTIFMSDTDKSGSALHSNYIKHSSS
jgi:hypothetical protein